jgi:hypothetical protein
VRLQFLRHETWSLSWQINTDYLTNHFRELLQLFLWVQIRAKPMDLWTIMMEHTHCTVVVQWEDIANGGEWTIEFFESLRFFVKTTLYQLHIPYRNFSRRHDVQTSSGSHPSSHSMGPGSLTFVSSTASLRIRGALPPFPHMSLWHGAELDTGTTSPLTNCVCERRRIVRWLWMKNLERTDSSFLEGVKIRCIRSVQSNAGHLHYEIRVLSITPLHSVIKEYVSLLNYF